MYRTDSGTTRNSLRTCGPRAQPLSLAEAESKRIELTVQK
jgi:hypothetical protein